MKKMLAIGTSIVFALASGAVYAVDARHPEDAKPVATANSKAKTAKSTKPAAPAGPSAMQMQQMDQMMKQMQDMHEKMMAATTPEERQKLMTEQRKVMQDGMAMMKDMKGMGCPMMGSKDSSGMMMGGDAMGKRMEMMQMMMQMMMDREGGGMPMGK